MTQKKAKLPAHPSHMTQIVRLNRVIGQLEGVKRMIEEKRYCPDVLVQTRAASAALKSVEFSILERHLSHCVSDALTSNDPKLATGKIAELVQLMKRF